MPPMYPRTGNPGVWGTAGARPVVRRPKPRPRAPLGYGAPQDILAAQRLAAATTNPVIKQIQAAIDAKAKAGMGAIGGYTNQLGQVLGGLAARAGDPYRQAQQGQAASDSALLQAVTGAGQDQAQGLAAKLAAIGAPQGALDATSGQVASNAQGSGGALYGMGSASLSELLGREATARDYAGKQVGIGGMAGLQAGRDLQMSSQKEFADQVGQVKAQVPDLITSALARIDGSREQKRRDQLNYDIAVQSGLVKDRSSQRSSNDKQLDRASRERLAAQRAAESRAAAQQKADVKAQNAKTKVRRDGFYEARERAFDDASRALGSGYTPAQTTASLRAKYGPLLRGYGYSEQDISRMIGNAVKAGRATPTKGKAPAKGAKAGSGSGARTGVGQQAVDALGGGK